MVKSSSESFEERHLYDGSSTASSCLEVNSVISIIVPIYNEQEVLGECYKRLCAVINKSHYSFEIIFVNDGSTDMSLSSLHDIYENDKRVTLIDLSRNFGKEIAMTAGIDNAFGDAAIIIDADLQDPPELIPRLIDEWENGYDVVYAKRRIRSGETVLKRITAFVFYRLVKRIGTIDMPSDTGDYRLINKRVIESLKQIRERHRFMKGIFTWVGFRQKGILYDREPRLCGTTKFNYWKLWNFALEGITSFSTLPLKISSYAGVLIALFAFVYGLFIILQTILFGNPVAGYPSEMVIILFLGGCQLIAIGIVGEYLGRLFDEAKKRPLYIINGKFNSIYAKK